MVRKKSKKTPRALRLNLGCGHNKPDPGWIGVDIRQFKTKSVDKIVDLRKRWPWKDDSVDEAFASHVLEHFSMKDRLHFMNELYRVLKPGGKATIVTPHWASVRAYGDPTHVMPPVCQMFYSYLDREWCTDQAPAVRHECRLTCDFRGTTFGMILRPDIQPRDLEYQTFAVTNYIEAAQDLIANMVKPAKRAKAA